MRDTLGKCFDRINDGSNHVNQIWMKSDENGIAFTVKKGSQWFEGSLKNGKFEMKEKVN